MIGKEVLCIETNVSPLKTQIGAEKGKVYKIQSTHLCSCGGISYDVGITSVELSRTLCACGKYTYPSFTWWQGSRRFVFMDDIDISEVVENVIVEKI